MFALYKLTGVISQHWQGNSCPMLGIVPACYLVFFGYMAMLLSVVFNLHQKLTVFLLGWAPVFLLAFTGTVLELTSKPTCPRTESDIPMCYLSLTVACLLIALFLFTNKNNSGFITSTGDDN
jgi:hypothetical protein